MILTKFTDKVFSEKISERNAELHDKTNKYKLLTIEYVDSQILSIRAMAKKYEVIDEDAFFGKWPGKTFKKE